MAASLQCLCHSGALTKWFVKTDIEKAINLENFLSDKEGEVGRNTSISMD
jgi:hypothetical protein